MAIRQAAVTVEDEATALTAGGQYATGGRSVVVSNPSGGAGIFLGGPDVTAANGVPLAAAASITLPLGGGDRLFAVVSTGTKAVNVMECGA